MPHGHPFILSLSRQEVSGIGRWLVEIDGAVGATKCASWEFVFGDLMSVEFEEGGFDAVVVFYSIFDLPREEHREWFERIYR